MAKKSKKPNLIALGLVVLIAGGLLAVEFIGFSGGKTSGQANPNQPGPVITESPGSVMTENPGPSTTESAPLTKPDSDSSQEKPSSGSLPGGSYSWWYSRQPNHQPSKIDPNYQKLLNGSGVWLGDTSQKRVYFTFDEGYENGYTAKILDTLRSHQVHAIFFVTGDYVDKNPELVKRMANEGHLIGNHSQTHPSFPNLTEEAMKREIEPVNQKVLQLSGQQPCYFRPPNGAFDQRTIKVASELGCRTTFWSFAYRDWLVDAQPGKEAAYNQVINNVHNGAVILLHAVSQSNSEALDQILTELEREGYSFGSLDEIK